MTIQAIAQTIANAIGGDETIGLTMKAAQEQLGFFAVPLTLNQVFSDRVASQLGWQPQGLSLAKALQQEYELSFRSIQ